MIISNSWRFPKHVNCDIGKGDGCLGGGDGIYIGYYFGGGNKGGRRVVEEVEANQQLLLPYKVGPL
jgi:hypothetical protein